MNFEAALFLINMCYHHYLHANNYWLKWEETAGRDQTEFVPMHTSKELFMGQMNIFVMFQKVVALVVVVV